MTQASGEALIHDLDAEAAVISTAMLAPEQIAELSLIVPPSAFYSVSNSRVWQAIIDLDSDREAVDVVTVRHKLDQSGNLRAVGGSPYLAELTDATPAVAHASTHARIVRDCATIRNVAKVGAVVSGEAHGEIPDLQKWIAERGADLSKALASQGTADARTSTIAESLSAAMDLSVLAKELKHGDQVQTGFTALDQKLGGVGPGELVFIAGRPGSGKTSMMLQAATFMARKHGVAFVSIEVEREKLAWKAISQMTGISFRSLRTGKMDAGEWEKNTAAHLRLGKLSLSVIDQVRGLTPRRLVARLSQEQHKRRLENLSPLSVVFVDYLQLMTSDGRHDSRPGELEEITRELKLAAGELNVALIVGAQLNRASVKESREPKLHDLRGSGSIEQDADVVIFCHREDSERRDQFDGLAKFIVAKSRNDGVGSVDMIFVETATRFDESLAGGPNYDHDADGDFAPPYGDDY